MARPKSILWVDDEVEGLAPHRRFLEEQGFTVAAAAHGDDALAMLRRQPYSVVLLDEQMPGRRGLELLPEIRSIDASVAVVMVTQSEDEGTLRDAIAVAVDDYLVKPVHPRQVLSVVTRLLDGERIRQQRLARDFVARFRELEGRRGSALAWREWIEFVVELSRWEVRLAASNEPGLSEALHSLQTSLRKDFAGYVARQYPRWLAHPEGDRPPLSVDVGAEFLVPILKAQGRVLFIVIDCLRLDQWEALRDLVTPLFDVEESHYYSILPTATRRGCGASPGPGSSARRCARRCSRRSGAASRCCSPPIMARFTAGRRPRCTPSATPPRTCATSSARICAARTRRPPSPWRT